MKQKNNQSESGHILIIIALVVVLLGALGFIFWQNFMQPKTDDDTDNTTTTITTTSSTTINTQVAPDVEPAAVANSFLSGFFSYMSVSGNSVGDFVSQSSISSLLTDSYKDSIINPSGNVYGSPITLTQDFPAGFTVDSTITVNNESTVSATMLYGINTENSIHVLYSLVLVENEWKIDGATRG